MEGLVAILGSVLAFLVPLAIPLFIQRWRTLAITVAIGAAILAWLYLDIEAAGDAHWLGRFLGGLLMTGFCFGVIAKSAMLLGRTRE